MSQSLAFRAVLAVLLTIGFYLLAVVLVLGLLGIVWADLQSGRVHARLVLGCLLAAGAVAWSVIPRRDRFEPPGPTLDPEEQPRLFAVIEEVAAQTGQAMPDEVYLVGDVNAFVAQRDTILGLGGRRVMGLGLPLMQAMSIPQFRGVIAHEFGHFHGGDTALGPWIYQTRAAMGRTVQNLAALGSLVTFVFQGYAALFLRVTLAVSRAQEYAADALAAKTQGADALAGGLRKAESAAAAFDAYWRSEVAPVLDHGARPPIAAGFGRFLGVPKVVESLKAIQAGAMEARAADPHDTHPPLGLRVAAVGNPTGDADDGPRASTLLDDLAETERRLLQHVFGPNCPSVAMGWDDVALRVHLPRMRTQAEKIAHAYRGRRLVDLDLGPIGQLELLSALGVAEPSQVEAAQCRAAARDLGGALALVSLVDEGWTLLSPVGEPLSLVRDGRSVDVLGAVARRVDGELDEAGWRAWCEAHGVGDVVLALAIAA